MKSNLFAYGTLLIPAVMGAVTGRSFEFKNATLEGFTRYKIKKQVFPGIIENKNGSVDGAVYYSIDEKSLQCLDRFESYMYQRKEVEVTLAGGRQVTAYTYVVAPEYGNLLTKADWELERFKRQHLYSYLKHI